MGKSDVAKAAAEAVVDLILSPRKKAARTVADYLAAGRAPEVTDEMMSQVDPEEMWRLYQEGATGAPMPMDEASRMARAKGMGLLPGLFRGARSDATAFTENPVGRVFSTFGDPDGYPVTRAGTFFSDNPEFASEYGAEIARNGTARYSEGAVVGAYHAPLAQPLPHPYDVNAWARDVGDEDAYQATRFVDHGWEMLDGDAGQAVKRYAQTYPKPPQALEFVEANPSLFDDDRVLKSTSTVVFDPARVRSRFARFDPRLGHLRNLSAGVGGVGLLGLLGGQNGQE